MITSIRKLSFALSFFTIFSLLFSGFSFEVRANDLIPSSDLQGGASVFVFRGSKKRPQEGGAVRSYRPSGAGASARRERVKSQVASARKRKADTAKTKAATLARARARERNTRLRLSNTLAAKGETQLTQGNTSAATISFRESLKNNPNNADAKRGLSEALTATGIETAGDNANEAALPYFDEAVKLDPKNEAAFAKLGEIHDERGRNTEAIANYEKALELDASFSSLYMPLGLAYAQAGNAAQAENYLNKAAAAGFDSSEAKFARATILLKQDKTAEALAAFEALAQAEPQNAQARYQVASVYNKMNQTDKAIDSYKQATSLDVNLAAAYFDLGVIQYNKAEYENAVASYQQVVRIEPQNYQAFANLASSFRQLERFAEANAAYKQAEPGFKNDPNLYSEWGYCLGKTEEWDKSVARLNTARELSPNAVDNNNSGWAYYNAARSDKKNNRQDEAVANLQLGKLYLETAVQQDPNMEAAYLNLGATKNEQGDHAGAQDDLKKALTIQKDWVIAMNQLGLAYRGTNDINSAISQFERVANLDSNNAFGLVNLGEVYFLAGKKKDARRINDRLRKVDPALANRLESIISGKVLLDEAKKNIPGVRIPRIPGFPY